MRKAGMVNTCVTCGKIFLLYYTLNHSRVHIILIQFLYEALYIFIFSNN